MVLYGFKYVIIEMYSVMSMDYRVVVLVFVKCSYVFKNLVIRILLIVFLLYVFYNWCCII